MPSFQTDRPFEVTGVDFAGPLHYKLSKKEDGKRNVLIFTCAASRAVHLEVTKDQTAEGFQRKLNAFIARITRPRMIISDNAQTLVLTPKIIKWGGNAYPLKELETDNDELTSMNRRLFNAKQHARQRWKREYIHALMETHRIKSKGGGVPEVGNILLIVLGDEKNWVE